MPKRNDRNYKSGKSSNPRANIDTNGSRDLSQVYGYGSNPTWKYDDDTKLREAQLLSFMSGLPIVGGFVRGVQGARYMDDYYRNSGMLPSYPGLNDPYGGYSTIGRSIGNTALSLATHRGVDGYNVKEGTNDLLKFYNYAYQ